MSLLDLVIGKVSGKKFGDDRAYRRFKTDFDEWVHAEGPEGETYAVEDLSFGGLAIKAGAAGIEAMAKVSTLSVQVLDQKLLLKVEVVRAADEVVAYRFSPRGLESIVALHAMLRGLETGADLRLGKSRAPRQGEGAPAVRLTGVGGCKLSLTNAEGKVQKLHLSFRDEGRDCELLIEKGRIVKATAIDGASQVAGQIYTGKHEKLVLRHSVYILMAVSIEAVRTTLDAPIALCLTELGLNVAGILQGLE